LKRSLDRFGITCALLLVLIGSSQAKDLSKLLSPHYREWLAKDVAYIITNQEKDAFLQLTSDEERDKFIDRFWDLRNPTPNSPENPYKVEYYRRLEYANQYFGVPARKDGWRSDMGRVYITLGAPQQKARYVSQSEVRPMEIWFYSNLSPALPPFFYVVFYEKDFGDFRLYSPYMDGPQKLVTSYQAESGRVAALQVIDRILGREVARTTLSLIPGEPVSMNDASSSLLSDVMLSTIKNLANHPATVDALNLRRTLIESISHRVVMPGELLNVLTVPLRDAHGNLGLHYLLRFNHASDFAVAQADKRYYYSIEVTVRVLTPDRKLIFTQERKVSRYIANDEMQLIKGKPFGYEGWLPLAPGKYQLEFTLANVLGKTTFPAQREVTVPGPPQDGFAVTDVVPFFTTEEIAGRPTSLPFAFSGVKFTPYAGQDLSLVAGQDLKVFYQIWLPTKRANDTGQKFLVDYAYGRPGVSGTAQTVHDEVSTDQFDPGGSIINGKKVSTLDLPQGNYRLVVTVTDPENQQKRFGSLAFHVVPDQPSQMDAWDITDDGLAGYISKGDADYERGLTYLAADNGAQAAECYRSALQKNPHHEKARSRLADFYLTQSEFAKILELYSQAIVTPQTEDGTILDVAESFDKTGNTRKAADWVESAVKVKPASGPLYMALASYYQRLGDAQKAAELERKGRTLMTATPETTTP
jgi:GWxTD domain-containing protein